MSNVPPPLAKSPVPLIERVVDSENVPVLQIQPDSRSMLPPVAEIEPSFSNQHHPLSPMAMVPSVVVRSPPDWIVRFPSTLIVPALDKIPAIVALPHRFIVPVLSTSPDPSIVKVLLESTLTRPVLAS